MPNFELCASFDAQFWAMCLFWCQILSYVPLSMTNFEPCASFDARFWATCLTAYPFSSKPHTTFLYIPFPQSPFSFVPQQTPLRNPWIIQPFLHVVLSHRMLYGDCRRISGISADGREGPGNPRPSHALASAPVAEEVGPGAEGRRGKSGELLALLLCFIFFVFALNCLLLCDFVFVVIFSIFFLSFNPSPL